MNGAHDMGGMHGFGPMEIDDNEPLFHAAWESRVRAMMQLARGYYNIDASRYGIEQMNPATYLASPYFHRWLASLQYNLIDQGLLTADEIEERTTYYVANPDAPLPQWPGPSVAFTEPDGSWTAADHPMTPRFAIGDAVIVSNVHPAGHTRRPRYIRGRSGLINMIHGPEIFADTNAHGLGENPQVVYNVRFDAQELWGASAEPNQTVSIDLWESYLERVPDSS